MGAGLDAPVHVLRVFQGENTSGGTLRRRGGPEPIFFSEYVEGSGTANRGLEIFNGTDTAIDLASSFGEIRIYANGAASPTTSIALTGSIAPHDVYVLASTSASFAAIADQTSSGINFSGDDAVVLVVNGIVLDVIGQVGFDPGSEWGSGITSTLDHTLRRKDVICQGDSNPADTFDPSTE